MTGLDHAFARKPPKNSDFSRMPYQLTVGRSPRFLWFRNAKCGTRSILHLLRSHVSEFQLEHESAVFYRSLACRDLFKFALVRNPWDRLVSGWLQKIVKRNILRFDPAVHRQMCSLPAFLEYLSDEELATCNVHFRWQSRLVDVANTDFLGRFESFERDVRKIFGLIGIPDVEVPHRNSNPGRVHYSHYFDRAARDMTARLYGEDIEVFGYTFDQQKGSRGARGHRHIHGQCAAPGDGPGTNHSGAAEANAEWEGLDKPGQAHDSGDNQRLAALFRRCLVLRPDELEELVLLASAEVKFSQRAVTRDRVFGILRSAANCEFSLDTGYRILRLIQYAAAGSERHAWLRELRQIARVRASHSGAVGNRLEELAAGIDLALGDYKEYLEYYRSWKERDSGVRKMFAGIAEKLSANVFPDFAAPKVFGIGLSRTGTSSLNQALQRLGLHSVHWLNPLTRDLLDRDDFFLFDAFTDICVSEQFEWLYHAFPNARFILTLRDVASWSRSVASHYRINRGVNVPSELSNQSHCCRFRRRAGDIEMNLYGGFQSWEAAHEAYHQRVESFFRDKPSDRLLRLDIIGGAGWEELCAFLDRPRPDQAFPWMNASPATPVGGLAKSVEQS